MRLLSQLSERDQRALLALAFFLGAALYSLYLLGAGRRAVRSCDRNGADAIESAAWAANAIAGLPTVRDWNVRPRRWALRSAAFNNPLSATKY